MTTSHGRAALALVVTADFVPGARVSISSFLRTNPWFDGDIVIIEPAEPCLAALYDLWPSMLSAAPSAAFLDALAYANPNALAFYVKGEALSLTGYTHVIVADADLLFQGTIAPALAMARPLAAAPDRGQLLGQKRKSRDYTLVEVPGEPTLAYTFCAGFLIFDGTVLGPEPYQAYLNAMRTIAPQRDNDGFDDQALLNVLYAGSVTPLGNDYNFMVSIIDQMATSLDNARVVHFNAIGKPWKPINAAPYALSNAKAGRAYKLWAQAWSLVGPAKT